LLQIVQIRHINVKLEGVGEAPNECKALIEYEGEGKEVKATLNFQKRKKQKMSDKDFSWY
jgi:hypothetical protein